MLGASGRSPGQRAEVPQVAFQVDEGHGGYLAAGLATGGPKSLISWLTGLFGLLVAGRATAGGCELAEQPQEQERLVWYPHLTDANLPEPGQLRQQLVAVRRPPLVAR